MFTKRNIDDVVTERLSDESFVQAKHLLFVKYKRLVLMTQDDYLTPEEQVVLQSQDVPQQKTGIRIMSAFSKAYEFFLRAGLLFYQQSTFMQKLRNSDIPTLKKQFSTTDVAFHRAKTDILFQAYVTLDETIQDQTEIDQRYHHLWNNLSSSKHQFMQMMKPFMEVYAILGSYVEFYSNHERNQTLGEFEDFHRLTVLHPADKLFLNDNLY